MGWEILPGRERDFKGFLEWIVIQASRKRTRRLGWGNFTGTGNGFLRVFTDWNKIPGRRASAAGHVVLFAIENPEFKIKHQSRSTSVQS